MTVCPFTVCAELRFIDISGVVTNVTDFGAFVDIGWTKQGLVHVSQLQQGYTNDPREVVQVGNVTLGPVAAFVYAPPILCR